MTSRRAGGEGSNGRAPPSPSSGGSEDNGFVNRPRVIGVYVKNLSRQELDCFVEEDIYGLSGSPSSSNTDTTTATTSTTTTTTAETTAGITASGREGASQSSSSSTSPSSTTYSISTRTSLSGRRFSQSTRSSRELRRRRQEEAERLRRSADTGDDRRSSGRERTEMDDRHEELDDPRGRSSQNSNEHSEDDSSRLSPSGYEVFDQEDSSERTIRQYADDSEPDIVLETDVSERRDEGKRADKIDHESDFSGLFPRCLPRSQQTLDDDEPHPMDRAVDDLDKGGEVRVKSRFRSQDSTRLRPPLVGTAGTSADSGTGDSASAEIQVDTLGTPQQTAGDVGDNEEEDEEEDYDEDKAGGDNTPGDDPCASAGDYRSASGIGGAGGAGASVSSSGFGYTGPKSGKQTVKPFTKESLDRLESRTVQLVREYGFQPRRKTSVEDGAVLPNKFEPFPSGLYGRPLEEIDNFIYDEI
ncbi:uncharacterized protein LOC103570260 [Microplitis demolitor]|uniref:uncharacterized protein LOC103570260 n=1 Tax=Microplitis demolitor TaxID=69319 RepID=UPI0004CD2A25|nr:uncharacterized protein LOC103570260 [Microplitis demolitor]